MTELFNAFATYLHDVFVIKFDGWVILGFVAQGFFTMRFVVQWIASERARKSVIPVAFWFFSIGGGVLLLIYALYRRDPVFIAARRSDFWSISAICTSSSSTGGNRPPAIETGYRDEGCAADDGSVTRALSARRCASSSPAASSTG